MKPFAFAGLLLVASCGSLAFAIDPAFAPSEREEIQAAAAAWNLVVSPENRLTFDAASWRVFKREPPSGGFNGLCRRSERTIWIRPQPIGATTYAVALHEFGHALGLGHTESGVMNPNRVTVEFSEEDLVECRRAGACK